ncbi:MerR family transcriptional regulator [Altererythrobacter sp. RZ02]|uniref:MerR family transcriptional regulator n=1 Tax=Pontixanthobacter rizhaonensis TaxID=2730337 RepID=A0A848QP03_9SPHN|nr:MerR family transcriptional regulator [Pontixanthobacter rizhaonensis]NMW31855.1 MerR family transcriptional regulator [Pontixanthobacter rizhaonensis]
MSANFDDGKEDGALRTIGEVSKALDIKTHVLRYWEQQFPMLEPLKRSGGRRYYRPEDVALIETIDQLVNSEGYTLKGAQQAIESGKAGGAVPDEQSEEQGYVRHPQAEAVPLELTTPIADSGGVGEFFGTSPAATSQPSEPVLELSEVQEDAMSRAEILARLKDIRGRLAGALAA